MMFSAIDIAYEWKMRPSQLGICAAEEDLPYMAAYLENKRLIDRIEAEKTKEEIERAKKKQGKGGKKGRR